MKKLSTYLFLIFFSFSAPSFADDIRDFQIEGMSIGDSLLDYFTEEEIKNNLQLQYYPNIKDKKFILAEFYKFPFFQIYDSLQIVFKTNDKKYKIYGIRGSKLFNNIKDCKMEYNKAVKELSEMFKNSEKVDAGEREYIPDPTGKSKTYSVFFWLKSGGYIEVSCFNMTEEFAKQNNWDNNNLAIGISSKEFSDFLLNEEYK